jgi:hypothetical protein
MSLLLALGGLLCLCLSMTRHQRDLLARPLPQGWSRALRVGGWAVLCLSFAAAVPNGAQAVLCWIGELSVVALIVVASCTLVPARRKRTNR